MRHKQPCAANDGPMVVMGRVAGAFGIKGWVKVQLFTQTPDSLLQFGSWWLGDEAQWRKFAVEEGALHGRVLIGKLAGVDERDAAAALKGQYVAVPREALPRSETGEYYWSELIGLQVRNTEGAGLGQVVNLIETAAQHVLVVQGERERLIPFADAVVVSVDLAGGSLVVDWGADF